MSNMTTKGQKEMCASASAMMMVFNDESDSTSSSSSEEEDLQTCVQIQINHNINTITVATNIDERIPGQTIVGYVEKIIPNYSREVFKQQFRMYPETVDIILGHIGPALRRMGNSGRNSIDEKKQLLVAIWFMATPDSYRSVKIKFGIGRATTFRAVRRVSNALHALAPHVIKWPSGAEIEENVNAFKNMRGFPGVIGAIDGTHIKIRAPTADAESYINRKGFHSIQLQVVCNAKNKFLHCFAGYPGSVHDARVFRNSEISGYLNNGEEYFSNDTHLLGDSAYPLHRHLLIPFRDNGHLTMRQRNYNYCHSATRMTIERTIGLFKGRFRILLDCLPLWDIKKIPEFIMACCVLHNICMSQNDILDIQIEENPAPDEPENVRVAADEAAHKRIEIMNNLEIRRIQ